MGTIAVNSVVEIVAQRIFSSSNVLALKCLTSMQPNFVKDMGSTNVDIFRCMNDVLNYLPQSNDFITFEIAALKAIAAWRLGAVLTCTKYITAVSTDTTAATAFGPCLSKVSYNFFIVEFC